MLDMPFKDFVEKFFPEENQLPTHHLHLLEQLSKFKNPRFVCGRRGMYIVEDWETRDE